MPDYPHRMKSLLPMHLSTFKRNVYAHGCLDIKFTIYFCHISTKVSIENDLNLDFNSAHRHFYLLWI